MKITGAECILKILKEYGVKHIFGYPGGAVLPLYDALLKTKDIKHILVRNEQAGAHSASAYAKITGNVGVCIGTSGPGATNLVTGIANAYMDSIPLIIITGQVNTKLIGTDSFQEVDITGITLPITKHNYLIKFTKDIPYILHEAYNIATTGRKGPVLLDIPQNILENKLNYKFNKKQNIFDFYNFKNLQKNNKSKIEKAIKLINISKKPLLLIGGGAISSRCETDIKLLVEKFNIPIVTTLMGIGIYDETKLLSLGMIGIYGLKESNYAINHCDLLIAVGTRFSNRSINFNKLNKNIKIIHIDIDQAELEKNIAVNLSIIGDAKDILNKIISKLNKLNINVWIQTIKKIKEKYIIKDISKKLTVDYIVKILGNITRKNCIVSTDVGQHQMFVAKNYKFNKTNTFITSGGLGTMGFGLPAAIGIAIATNKLINIIVITGDGSFQMNMSELSTIVENDLPIKIILINNSSLCMVKQLQTLYYNKRYSEVFLTGNPNFLKLVSSYKNIKTYCIKEKKCVEKIIKKAFLNKKPSLIECIVDNESIV